MSRIGPISGSRSSSESCDHRTQTDRPAWCRRFSDTAGVTHSLHGFGLHEGTDWGLRESQAAQVKVLFSQTEDGSDQSKPIAFSLDLTADRAERQVIIAVLPRAERLRAASDDLARRIENSSPDQYSSKLHETDTLPVPNVAFSLDHEFAELEGPDKRIENPSTFQDLYIVKAWQSIRFRLDKSGASVVSESGMYPGAIPRHFIVDRPFLVVMKRRLADQPYFVAWIENAESLETNPATTLDR